ncbi:hypothetical protein [Saccharopolyspora hattusasensis]|uniref:hypothetical protein n=1 Tax=Saccharopolyspora hattusasensis TaxID=1128679 RepID=UPI003D97BEBD
MHSFFKAQKDAGERINDGVRSSSMTVSAGRTRKAQVSAQQNQDALSGQQT